MAQLSRARDRSMHSIVATIQAEQDKAIRAPEPGRRRDRPAAPAPARRWWRCTARRTSSTPTGAATRAAACWWSAPAASSCATSSGCCPSLGETAVALRSLGEVVDGVRATRHDEPAVADVKGSARMAELMRRTARQQAPGSPERVPGLLARRRASSSTAGMLGRVRRQLMSQGRRNRQLPRVGGALLDAHVAPGPRRARPRPGPRGLRRRHARRRTRSSTSRSAWWPPLDARTGARLAARPRASSPGSPTACSATRSSGCWPSRGPARADLSVEDVPLLDELRYALGDVPGSAPTTSATSTTPPCSRAASTCRSC